MSNPSEQPNASAIEAISKKLIEVTNLAEQLDSALKTVHDAQNENATRSQSSDEQCTEDARSESEEFVTASECTCTPQSRSSSYHTASECGTSPWLDQELDQPLTSPTQQVSSKLIREITETRTFKVKQCQVASAASLVRTCQEFKERQDGIDGYRDESGEWITVKVVEAQPDLTSIGNDLQEAMELQTAHLEVLRQLKNKATPVEELMRQVDKKVSSQRPEPEVYAAMAESLGTAWQSINRHLEHRKQILDLSVTFQSHFEQCLQRMATLDAACADEDLPIEIDAVKDVLTEIHELRRSVLESIMPTLQEGGHLLDHLKELNTIGTLDSRPGQIKPSVGSAITQVENWLEMMHDRRKALEISWQNRKNRLEQCLALAMLAKDLCELDIALSERKERVGDNIQLGDSEYSASMLITEFRKILQQAKELQERALKITRATEQLVKSGCFAGREASDKAYSILGGCSDFINDLEMREMLLIRALTFFENGRQTLNQLDDYEREIRQNDLIGTLPRLTPVTVTTAVEDITHDVIKDGRDLLTECGIDNPGAQAVRQLVEEIENRTIQLRWKCEEMRKEDRKIGEALLEFQERQNELSTWLRMIAESFLQGHQDMGNDLLMAKDFYNMHHELLKDLEIKGNEINSLLLTLPPILEYLDEEQRKEVDRKVDSLHERWTALKSLLEVRLDLSAIYVQFHSEAKQLNEEFDKLDRLLIRSSACLLEDKLSMLDEQWTVIRPLYNQLKSTGQGFLKSVKQRDESDPHLDTDRACLCVESILQSFAGRQVLLTEQQDTWRTQITSQREVYEIWRKDIEQAKKTMDWVLKLDNTLYPVLTSLATNANELVVYVDNRLQRAMEEIKQAQEELEQKIRATEELITKDNSLLNETQPVKENMQQLHQKLNSVGTEYQLLLQMIISFMRNVSELDKSIENVQNKYMLPLDLQTDLESFSKDHEASKKIIMEMFKLIVNESDDVINRIRQQEPNLAAQHDIEKILSMLEYRRGSFEASWNATNSALDQSLRTGQFDGDLQDINTTIDDLTKQLTSVRGQYGETLATAKASSLAFEYFERTIELLQNRIDTFITSSDEMFSNQPIEYPRVKRDLDNLANRWNNFRREVAEVRRLIDLSILYFKLVDEADDWFREGNKLLGAIARKTTTVKTEDDALKLLSEIESFVTIGQTKQEERINKMSALARELYNDSRYTHLNKIQNENRDMIESFNSINSELKTLIEKLKQAAIDRDDMQRKQDELSKNLADAKAEVAAAQAAAMAAEQARKEAEELSKQLTEPRVIVQQKIIQTTTSESQTVELGISPNFTVPLNDAVISEGSKFVFECHVMGEPEPDITWYKDGMCIENNPDYKTTFECGRCTLTIEETFTEDSAKFKCKASNRYGTADTQATLTVREVDTNTLLEAPVFTRMLKSATVSEGSSFQFECTVSGNPLPVVQWFKNDVCIDNSSDYAITYNNGDAILRFEEAFIEDQAQYLCKASNDVGMDQCMAYLTVKSAELRSAPSFTMSLSNTMARAGQKIKLECRVTGKPEPELQWKHNGKVFSETADARLQREGERGTLVIAEAFPKDAGLYTVTARNSVGEISSSCNVSVKGRFPNETSDSEQPSDMEPVKPSVQLPLQNCAVQERDRVRFDCVIVGQPEPEVIWYHDDRPVKESSEFQLLFQGDRCSLIICEAFIEDAGEYKVVAINSAGEASSKCSLTVIKAKANEETKVQGLDNVTAIGTSPKFIKLLTDILIAEKEEVILECTVTGEPKPDVKWFHNTLEIIPNERIRITYDDEGLARLAIREALPGDKGIYTVKAINSCGDAKCFAQLIVKSVNVPEAQRIVPQIIETGSEAPAFKELFADRNVPDGNSTKFECIVTGKPAPKIKWFFDNLPVSGKHFLVSCSGDRQILTIPSVSAEHNGNISCVAENEIGKATCTAILSVDDSDSLLQRELTLPTVAQNSKQSSIFMKQEVITQTSSQSSTTYGTGEPKVEIHSVTSQSYNTAKQINEEPPVITQQQKIEEYHQSDKQPPSTREETLLSTSVDRNTNISESLTSKIEPVKVFNHVRKTVSPRFISPLIGRIVDKGADIILEGIVDGYPTPEIKWTKDKQDLHVGGSVVSMTWELNKARIELKNVGIEDAGRFTCTATNSAGVASSTADIVVKKSVFPPVFGRRLQAQVVKKGDRVIMEVEVSGTPEPTITWHKDNKPIQEAMASPFRIKTQGLCHSLIIDKVTLEDSGKYMVRAVNAGGEAQSIADFAVFEPTPDTMVEVVKTMVFEDLQDQTQKQPVKIMAQQTGPKEPAQQLSCIPSMQTNSQVSQIESVVVTETHQTEQKFKMEHKTFMEGGSDISKLTQQAQTSEVQTLDKKPPIEPKISSALNTEKSDGIETESISKRTALDFFVTKLEQIPPNQEYIKREEQKTYTTPMTPHVHTPCTKEVIYRPMATDFIIEKKEVHSQAIVDDFDLVPGPPPEIGYMPKIGSEKRTEDVAHKIKKLQDMHKDDVVPPAGGIKIFSIPTPAEEFTPIPVPVEHVTNESISSCIQQTLIQDTKAITQPVYRPAPDFQPRPTSPRPATEAFDMQTSWNRPISPKPVFVPTTDKPATCWSPENELRSFSAMSQISDKGIPSADGVAMDKIWAHKRPDSSLNVVWPPIQTEDEKIEQIPYSKEEMKMTEITNVIPEPKPKIQEPKLHYVAHTTVCEKQTAPLLDSSVISEKFEQESRTYKEFKSEESIIKSMNSANIWPPSITKESDLQAPQMIQKLISKTQQSQDITVPYESKDELLLEPGPSPEMCFAPRTTAQRRQSNVESIEQDLEKSLDKVPSRVLPGAVRTIPPPKVAPPPIPPKEQFTPAPPLPSKPDKQKTDLSAFQPFPQLEPFPFKPDTEKPKAKGPPPPIPSKFIKAEVTESEHDSDIEIKSKWTFSEDLTNKGYRKVLPPSPAPLKSISIHPIPEPPSQFERPSEIISVVHSVKDLTEIETNKKSVVEYENFSNARNIPEPVLIPGPAPIFVQPDSFKKPKAESPKIKPKFHAESGYMADTEDTLRQYSRATETKTFQFESTGNLVSNIEKNNTPAKFYRHHVHKTDKTFLTPGAVSQTKDLTSTSLVKNISMTSREIKFNEELEPFPFKPETSKPTRVICPPPPSPSKFIKGEFRESDYESDYDGRIPPVWRPNESDTDERTYKPVRVALTTTHTGRHSKTSEGQKSPTPPTEFDNPPEFTGPPRPKFSPIEKLTDGSKTIGVTKTIQKQQIYKPKPMSAKPTPTITDYVVATPAIKSSAVLQPSPQPEMGYAPPPKYTQYYTATAGMPYTTETSKTMHFNESTENSHRVLNISQTTRVIKFGEERKEETVKLEPFPFTVEPDRVRKRPNVGPVPKPRKFVPGEFRESDYESEVESARIRPKWTPGDSDTEEPYYRKVKPPMFTRSSSLPRSYGRVMTPMEFDMQPPLMPTDTSKHRSSMQTDLKRFAQYQQDMSKESTVTKVATNVANRHMEDMSQAFRSKVHRFADQVLTDVKQTKQKPILKTAQTKLGTDATDSNAQAYREESRFAQYGTKHIDPDTGLIYFKYDFGYEFGILFPGEGRKVIAGSSSTSHGQSGQSQQNKRTEDIVVPIIHEKSNGIPQGFNTLPMRKSPGGKNVKWEPQSESEWSDMEEVRHSGCRWDQTTPSPKSLSPSIPSQSPRYFYQPPTDASDRSCNSTPASSRVYSTGHNGEIAKPPIFITPLKDIAAVAGQPARFECIVQADPNPAIVWAKDGRMLQPSQNHETYYRNGVCRLTIPKAYPDDAGTYTCTATNCAGARGSSATLQVPGERWSTYLKKL